MVPCYRRFPQHPVGPCEKPLTKHSSRNAPGAMARTSRLLSLVLAAFAVATSLGVFFVLKVDPQRFHIGGETSGSRHL